MRTGVIIIRITSLLLAWQLAVANPPSAPSAAANNGESQQESAAPVKLDSATLAGVGLHDVPPVPQSYLLSGVSRPRSRVLYEGDALKVEVYEEQRVKFPLPAQGMPYDEFVHVLDGTLVLTDSIGRSREFNAGDFLVIPKGFKGTWETRGPFRELVVVERTAWEAVHGAQRK